MLAQVLPPTTNQPHHPNHSISSLQELGCYTEEEAEEELPDLMGGEEDEVKEPEVKPKRKGKKGKKGRK